MRVLVALAELQSVRAAPDALSLGPSAVSRQLKRLEDQVGRHPIVRSRTGLVPTAEGADLAQVGRRLPAFVHEVGERLDRESVSGHVRPGITEDIGLTRVPDVLRQCAARIGLGVSPLPRSVIMRTEGVTVVRQGLPALPDVEPGLLSGPRTSKAIRTLRDALLGACGTPDRAAR